MDAAREIAASVPAIDLVVLGLLLLGALWGLLRGLVRLFGALLWTLLALWLGATLAPTLLEHMPNTELADTAAAMLDTFGVVVALVLLLPLLARVLGGTGGGEPKQAAAKDRPRLQRGLGAVAGVGVAVLLATLVMPFALRLPTLRTGLDQARAPALAEGLAGSLALFYPAELGASLRAERGATPEDG